MKEKAFEHVTCSQEEKPQKPLIPHRPCIQDPPPALPGALLSFDLNNNVFLSQQ